MLRRAVAVLFLAIGTARPAAVDPFQERALRFNQHWSRFLRSYLGCPKEARDTSECNPQLGSFDYAEFLKAAKDARALFALDEK